MKERCRKEALRLAGRTEMYGRKLLAKLRKYVGRDQILCLIASVILALVGFSVNNSEIEIEDRHIQRPGYGREDNEIRVLVSGIDDEPIPVSFTVSHRTYSDKEAEELFEQMMEKLPSVICAGNQSLLEVYEDLCFPEKMEKYPGVRISCVPDDLSVIDSNGHVRINDESEYRGEEETGNDAIETELRVTLRAGDFTSVYVLPVVLRHSEKTEKEKVLETLKRMIGQEDQQTVHEQILVLPESVEGLELTYQREADYSSLKIILLGAVAAVLVSLRPKQEEKEQRKIRENQLSLDYSELVSKLIIYLGAGDSLRNAWGRIAVRYQEQKERTGQERYVYEEMVRTYLDMEKGVSDGQAYLDFARRCGLRQYVKLAALLEQNRKNGGRNLRDELELEMQDALEQRKNTARKLGEEAGTKLIVPLVMSLVAVIMIVMVPALLTI